ncbi:hypothetical protein [Aromatoleum diolicum]|uniref:Uncharacterized protein n=1 Tax=Aromatoleum diolicum TaxID=75796 RepID=A0ABX1QB89_9RHOO|nr:hypothetical protein [Aromatoleum diolicum]NMG75649.1 hypothetical protein [Aromatoleum diolicum]
MTIRLRHIAALAFVPLSLAAGSASAALGDYSGMKVCSTEFAQVYWEIQNATYTSAKNAAWNKSALVVKLDSAESKVAGGKFGEAVDYLQQISAKATEWADFTPKPKLESADGINTSVSAAIGCVTVNTPAI